MKARQMKAVDYALIKAQTRRLISAAGGLESAEQVTRVKKSVIGDYQNVAATAMFMPVDIVADLESDTGLPYVTEALVKLAGGYMVRVPSIISEAAFPQQFAIIAKETSDVFERAAHALQDGKVSAEESQKLLFEISEAINALAQARAILEKGCEK